MITKIKPGRMKRRSKRQLAELNNELLHVGGINKTMGGIDPEIDMNLQRLSNGY